jgi:hypothetical protein
MTNTKDYMMSTHANHDHPATPAARAACRRRANRTPDVSGVTRELVRDLFAANRRAAVLEFDPTITRPTFVPTTETHCELCGTFDAESLETGDQGYTACCNELQCDGRARVTWAWTDGSEPITSSNRTGTIVTCCSARVSLPHDMIRLSGI